jgi:WD40 repeat protein
MTTQGSTVLIRDAQTGEELLRLTPQAITQLTGAFWSRDGKRLFISDVLGSGTYSATYGTSIWDAQTGQQLDSRVAVYGVSREHRSAISSWSPDLRMYVIVQQGQLGLFDLQGKQLAQIPSADIPVLVWSPDSTRVASLNSGRTVSILNTNTLSVVRLPSNRTGITCIAWTLDSRHLATAATDHFIDIWDIGSMDLVSSLSNFPVITMIAWNPDGRRFATIDQDGLVTVGNAFSGGKLLQLPVVGARDVSWSAEGSRLLVSSYSESAGTVSIWRIDQTGTAASN